MDKYEKAWYDCVMKPILKELDWHQRITLNFVYFKENLKSKVLKWLGYKVYINR